MNSRLSLTGIGLRTQHHAEILAKLPKVAWLEVHSENFLAEGGKSLYTLEQARKHYPISLHGVALSIGSSDDLNWQHLKKLRDLIDRIDPCLVSDHLAWSSFEGQYFHDLFPLPYTAESLLHVIQRVKQVQDYLNRQILIENISSYVSFTASTIPEWDFLQEVASQSGCGILLDVNNLYVSATNLGFNPKTYLSALSSNSIQEIHVAGFSSVTMGEKEILIDSHSKQVVPAVWDLFRQAIKQFGVKPTIIEWDTNLPSLETLCLEAYRAEQIIRETYATTKLTG